MTERMRKKIRWTGILIMISLTAVLLCACAEVRLSSDGMKDDLIQLGEASCSKKEALFMLLEEKAVYEEGQNPENLWERKIGSENMSSYVKDIVKEQLIRYTAAEDLSDQLAVYLTDEEKAGAEEAAVTAWTKISGLYNVDEAGITAEDVSDLYYKKALYNAVYQKIVSEAASDVTEDSTRVILADYVLIPAEDGEDAAYAVYSAIREGTDFAEACKANGYQMVEEQVIPRGMLPNDVDSIAFALKDGEFSEVIESLNGCYIFYCIDDKLLEESAANYNEILNEVSETAFREKYDEYAAETRLFFDDGYWNKIQIGKLS